MSRPRARLLELAEALKDALERDASEHPEDWLVVPQKFGRGIRQSYMTNGPWPCVVVAASELTGTDQALSDGGITEVVDGVLSVYGIVNGGMDGGNDAEASAVELEADLFRAISRNRNLDDGAGNFALPDGYVHWERSEFRYEPLDVGVIGECEITLQLKHQRMADTA